ncbi:hypothetical protein ECHHL_0635 [Ehrlichia chaffeensis str. Heartland]|uniref:Uncharacterized protein n=1 Tax=Ehrlichia chaffeensis (strain ATCC CRL-10679 / Arkansas) TaxID=205920 RepID=Q2GGB3_EHRCR|nr:hypothetical protein [Ehrlichia chaffeensis]ABD45268.1 hypothetical protein ECH_0717 [Ehrlichia chaffeensis str. Arkansas]AHX03787.1 hypothetical protein ECHHL_0635 [Ehrlichia chaffeensis str. Heartland]AHX05487.1 hypothetical protein ECHJAX_0417 [Ehrlichia chaffeensis str. Jax]AHX06475.1 hypothetical protein ECHLIB_0414 [Ehrlichia chaffeensis str. Liberty]AHX07379.1 hypothetical protein ECHOSC_0648 [Ehrlichia chaffeensis str. Osceola]
MVILSSVLYCGVFKEKVEDKELVDLFLDQSLLNDNHVFLKFWMKL